MDGQAVPNTFFGTHYLEWSLKSRVVPKLREEIEWSLNMSNYFTHAFGYQPAEISKLAEISATRFVVCCDLHTCLQSVGLPPSLQSL